MKYWGGTEDMILGILAKKSFTREQHWKYLRNSDWSRPVQYDLTKKKMTGVIAIIDLSFED